MQASDGTLVPEYRDAQPGGWLIWSGGGGVCAKRYACARHREDLIADLRRHYGATRSAAVRSHAPDRALWRDGFSALGERELEDLLARAARHPGQRRRTATTVASVQQPRAFDARGSQSYVVTRVLALFAGFVVKIL